MADYMPTGGDDQAIGDLGRLQGTDPKIRIRQEIVAEHHRLWNSEEIGAATHSGITLQAGVNVAAAREAAKDQEIQRLREQLERAHFIPADLANRFSEYMQDAARRMRHEVWQRLEPVVTAFPVSAAVDPAPGDVADPEMPGE